MNLFSRASAAGMFFLISCSVGAEAHTQFSPTTPVVSQEAQRSLSRHKCTGDAGASTGPVLGLTLKTGTEIEGRLVGRAEPDGLVLCDVAGVRGRFSVPGPSGSAATISRSEVRTIDYGGNRLRYKDADANDAELLHALVEVLGTGKGVDVKTRSGEKIRGRITSIHAADFVVARAKTSEAIAYREVTELRPTKLHWGAKLGIASASVLGVFIILALSAVPLGP